MRGNTKYDVKVWTEKGSLNLCVVIFSLTAFDSAGSAKWVILLTECWVFNQWRTCWLHTYTQRQDLSILSLSHIWTYWLSSWKQVLQVKALISPIWWFTEKTYDPQTLKFLKISISKTPLYDYSYYYIKTK